VSPDRRSGTSRVEPPETLGSHLDAHPRDSEDRRTILGITTDRGPTPTPPTAGSSSAEPRRSQGSVTVDGASVYGTGFDDRRTAVTSLPTGVGRPVHRGRSSTHERQARIGSAAGVRSTWTPSAASRVTPADARRAATPGSSGSGDDERPHEAVDRVPDEGVDDEGAGRPLHGGTGGRPRPVRDARRRGHRRRGRPGGPRRRRPSVRRRRGRIVDRPLAGVSTPNTRGGQRRAGPG
jgi:hypothetical protein